MNTPAATRNFLLSAVLGVSGRWHGAWAMPSEMPPMRSCRACGLCVGGVNHRKSSRVFTCRHHNESGWQPSDKGGDDATDLLPTVSVRLHPHDRSAGPRPQPAPAAVGARTAEVLVARLTARSRVPGGATGRGPAPAASRAAPPPDAGAHAVTLGAARLSLNITSIRSGVWAGFEVTSLSALVDASLVSITYSAACAGQHIS